MKLSEEEFFELILQNFDKDEFKKGFRKTSLSELNSICKEAYQMGAYEVINKTENFVSLLSFSLRGIK
jgi:hypothetical protein